MTLRAEIAVPGLGLRTFLARELAPRPGRIAAVARIVAGCVLITMIGMLYRIPLTAYMAYIVFLISRDDTASTVLTGVVGGLAATVAVALSLLFFMLDAAEPALRLPLMAGAAFIGMFLARTAQLGPIAFLASFVLVLSQTLIDEAPSLEALTHLVLWLWVVAVLPDVLTIGITLLFGESPARLARRTALRLLATAAEALEQGDPGPLDAALGETTALLQWRRKANIADHDLAGLAALDTALIEGLAEVLLMLRLLPIGTPVAVRTALAAMCRDSADAFARAVAPTLARPALDQAALAGLSPEARPVVVALIAALVGLSDGLSRRLTADQRRGTPQAARKPLLVADAFTDPGHVRFALKTTIAVIAAYIIYSGLAWPGLRTAITTCFFVALGSLGESMHKLTLRLGGAVIGGLTGGLCIIFVLPAMTDIGQLCLLVAAVVVPCAWVATSSERLSYAGMQMAFAFFLGLFQGYAPDTDLTGLRDRVLGILLGNLLISLIFSVIWPISVADRARLALAGALRSLRPLPGEGVSGTIGTRLAVVGALGEARRFVDLAAFEIGLLAGRSAPEAGRSLSLAALNRLAAAAFVVMGQGSLDAIPGDTDDGDAAAAQPDSPAVARALASADAAASAWFEAAADRLASGPPSTAPTCRFGGLDAPDLLDAATPPARRAAIEARLLLQREIDNVIVAGA
ncbi:MAG: FUSC family protein [Azospirillaceae bacterium]|nr:FUSC family protein [Azospirillaceae bacterium]